MKPPMRQQAVIYNGTETTTNIDGYDDYGNPIVTEEEKRMVKARVRRRANLIQSKNGDETNTDIEIDVESDVIVIPGFRVDFVDAQGIAGTGDIVSYEETTNLSGSRVLFKTVYVNGR